MNKCGTLRVEKCSWEFLENINIGMEKAEQFALETICLCNTLRENQKEFIISKQLFRSSTSIGANIAESIYASSSADFINKLQIALKEASETEY